ncbi:MAG: hypothetical protein Q9160_007949 [Pyrenula sp. 1 TL-2023]
MNEDRSIPSAWDDNWETGADKIPTPPSEPAVSSAPPKKVSSKVTKAQKRAQQAEFNRQLWAEAEGPQETFHFLETRPGANVPLKSEFKPPPILLSRKGPVSRNQSSTPPVDGITNLSIAADDGDNSDDGESEKKLTPAEQQAKSAKDREEKQRKYEERREQLFGANHNISNTTPPSSRSGTPSRGRGGRGKNGNSRPSSAVSSSTREPKKDLFDPAYSPKPTPQIKVDSNVIQPIRQPRGPDPNGGFGFAFGRGGDNG